MNERIFLNCLQNIINVRNATRKYIIGDIKTSLIEMDTTLDALGLSSINLMEIIVTLESELDIEFEVNRDYNVVGDLFADIRC